jgi:hypothetical protein
MPVHGIMTDSKAAFHRRDTHLAIEEGPLDGSTLRVRTNTATSLMAGQTDVELGIVVRLIQAWLVRHRPGRSLLGRTPSEDFETNPGESPDLLERFGT